MALAQTETNMFSVSGSILSAKELFQWRKKENLAVPQRGGAKDFEPDGSWLEDKRLEAFYEEHQSVLSEPRVEKSGTLVKGEWNADMKLVNIEKTAKFWMKMGFTDQQRNWLHPEEALLLMEMNCLDLTERGVSLSLQEAYSLLLHPSSGVTEEEYQVYAHLRRLGFIVVNHAGKLDVTPYERKIGLDKHIKKEKKRSKKQKKSDTNEATPEQNSCEHSVTDQDIPTRDSANSSQSVRSDERLQEKDLRSFRDSMHNNSELDSITGARESSLPLDSQQMVAESIEDETVHGSAGKRKHGSGVGAISGISEPSVKRTKGEDFSLEQMDANKMHQEQGSSSDVWSCVTQQSLRCTSSTTSRSWNFKDFNFPDMGGGKDTVCLTIPPARFLPPNTCMDEEYDDVCMFDIEEYRRQREAHQLYPQPEEAEDYEHLKQFEFSYAEWCSSRAKPVTARNWSEWKAEMRRREESNLTETPVSHLWQGNVTPLLEPKDAFSTEAILDKLSVIKTFQGPFPPADRPGRLKISYDVYLPNTNYKKSNPGLPDHRVCIARSDEPPDLFEVQAATAHLSDSAPLHWAVVSSGEISFHVFELFDLPVHPSSLG